MRSSQIKCLLVLAAAFGFAAEGAAKWETVATVKGERIEIDKSRIVRQGESRSTAWSRVALERDFIDDYGLRYTAIEAQNRYDCAKKSFATVKRIFRRDGQLVREEAVANVREMPAAPGSADELLLTEACRLRTVGEAQKVAETAARLAAEAVEGRPTVMHADMRTAEAADKAKPVQVADKPPEAKPAAKPNDKPAEAAPNDKPAERPRFIDLPKIDRSQFEDPSKAAAAKAVETKPAAKPATKPERLAERPAEKSPSYRHEVERQYATSGPRKTAKSKMEAAVAEHREIHWSYEGEGAPANWSKLRTDYATCAAGQRQSPIDIRDGIKVDLEPIQFDYKLSRISIVDNGHTVQVSVGEGSTMRVMERSFQLVQFHFHKPSEERINGRAFDMVVHLVHKDDDGRLAVIAVLLEKGSEHPLIQVIWNNLPLDRHQEMAPSWVVDPAQLLPPPDRRAYVTYIGSLTTPPCTEDVLWMVFKQPMQVSPQQVGIFSRLYSNNARPIQPSNGRLVKESR